MVAKNRFYNPTSDELNEVVASFLKENADAKTKDVQTYLLKEHKTWRLPERRVRKYVKKQQSPSEAAPKSGGAGSTDDDSVMSTASTASQRARRAVKGTFKSVKGFGRLLLGKKKKGVSSGDETSPITEIKAESLLPPMKEGEEEPADDEMLGSSDSSKAVEAEDKKDADGEKKDREVYQDDNDGVKECDPCGFCEGCIIL